MRGGVAADATGNAYFSTTLHCVFKLDANGIVTVVAGNSRPGYSGDGGPATSAQLNSPRGLAVDATGNLFIADSGNHRIRKVSPSGIIVTVAGNGNQGFSGDGGPATTAQLNSPGALAVDGVGNLFMVDSYSRVRKVSREGIITTVAGNGVMQGFSGDGGPATSATVYPTGVAVDGAGNLFFADSNARVRKVSRDGIITTVAGTEAVWPMYLPVGVAVDGAGNLYVGELQRVLKVSPDGTITPYRYSAGSVAADGAGNLFITDSEFIREIAQDGSIATVAGKATGHYFDTLLTGGSGDGGPATGAQLILPTGVAVDGAGNLFIADPGRIRKVSPGGIINTVAGDGTIGFSGDGGPATSAHIGGVNAGPFRVAVDDAGNLFLSDTSEDRDGYNSDNRVRKVSPDGIITTVAGNGTQGLGDGGPAASAQLAGPAGIAVDGAGNLLVADEGNNRIRRISPDGIITTVAQVSWPLDVAVDGAGNLFIVSALGGSSEVNFQNGLIRKVSSGGVITTVAGTGSPGFSGDGGPATSAQLTAPIGVAVDGAGNLFIADVDGNRIRRVSPDGIITTVAGDGSYGFSGDGGVAASAQLNHPEGVAVDRAGNVYVADTGNQAIRVLRPTNRPVLISAVVDAASQRADPVSPGKIVVIYGAGLGPAQLVRNQASRGALGTELSGTTVSFNGIAAPVLYASASQVAAVAPYALAGTTAQVTVTCQGQASEAVVVSVAPSAPSLFTLNQTGAGQAAAINAADGTVNTAANPVKIGGYISLFATGEGQTSPPGVDGSLGGLTPTHPILPVSVTVGGMPATIQYRGGVQGQVAGLIQVNVRIPDGVQPGGYVPVVLQVGDASTTSGAVWIAVTGN